MVTDEEDIRQSLFILLSTTPGERVHRFDFGCNLKAFSYEPMTESTCAKMKEEIEKAILLYEPRIILNKITLTPENNGVLYITLEYTIRSTNMRSNMVYPFYLQEGTDI